LGFLHRADWITYKGERKRRGAWADKYGIPRKTFTTRLTRVNKNLGRAMTFEEAIVPVDKKYLSRDEVEARRQALYDIVEEQRPMIVRTVYYQAVVRGIVEKTERGLGRVEDDVLLLRESGRMPYSWMVDHNRTIIEPNAFDSFSDALEQTADQYWINLWKDADELVLIFLEKVGLAGAIESITLDCGVPLIPVRGYSSHSFLWKVAQRLRDETRPVHAYLLGDWDPSGVDARRFIKELMARPQFAPKVDFRWHDLALTPAQIKKWKLPTRPTKESDSRTKNWGGGDRSVELDAVEPTKLRKLVKDAIDKHMNDDERAALRVNEERDRARIRKLAADNE
jgi:hypothetical protein